MAHTMITHRKRGAKPQIMITLFDALFFVRMLVGSCDRAVTVL